MNRKKLAEALMFQCMEDLHDPRHRQQSMDFFAGEGFHLVAAMAEMGPHDRSCLMQFIRRQFGRHGMSTAGARMEDTEHTSIPTASVH